MKNSSYQFFFSKRKNPPSFWAGNANLPPLIGFHGDSDKTLRIDTLAVRFSPNVTVPFNYAFYNSESQCLKNGLTYKLEGVANTDDLFAAGSIGIYKILKYLNVSVEVYVDCNMGHGVSERIDDLGILRDNFGLPNVTKVDNVYKYMVQRAATFFQAVLTGKDTLRNTDLFYECVNNRVKSYPDSQLADNIGNCPNSNAACAANNLDDPGEQPE